MTPNQPQPMPMDPGNGLLAETPANLITALVETPQGQRLALTIRTASTTLTILLGAADARTWGAQVVAVADQMSKSGLIVTKAGMNGALNGH